jgi:CRISPR-associated protein Csm4
LKLYEIILKPLSGFGSAMKGDMLFGQFCWQIANDPDCSHKIGDFIRTYSQSPFIIFSSAFPKISGSSHYVFKKPDVPAHLFSSNIPGDCESKHKAHKDKKGRKWFLIEKKPGTAQFDTIDFKFIR